MQHVKQHMIYRLSCISSKLWVIFKVIQRFVFIYSIHGCPMSDTGQPGDRVASWYCQRCDSFSTNGIVSSSKQNMADMFQAISDDFEDASACDQTINILLLATAYHMETKLTTTTKKLI